MNYREVRESLGLTLRQMGANLGLSGDNAPHVVWEIENNRREPTGPIKRVYELLDSQQHAVQDIKNGGPNGK